MQSRGYSVAAYHPADLTRFKLEQDIGLRYQSCHTAISAGGYRFEGHVPAKFVSHVESIFETPQRFSGGEIKRGDS